MYVSRSGPLSYADISIFLTVNQQVLLYHETQILIGFWNIISNSFNFFGVFKDCFNKHGYNFDDVSKNNFSWSS